MTLRGKIYRQKLSRQKLSRLKLSRLRPYRHRLPRLRLMGFIGRSSMGLRLGWGGGPTKLYTPLRVVKNPKNLPPSFAQRMGGGSGFAEQGVFPKIFLRGVFWL